MVKNPHPSTRDQLWSVMGSLPSPHEASTETFYVLSGEAHCHVGDEETTLKAGHCGYAPPGISHTVRNIGQEDLHAISILNRPLE